MYRQNRTVNMTGSDSIHQDPYGGIIQWMVWLVNSIPGRDIVVRYIASSYQHDPVRSLLELILFIFALRTILQNRTRARGNSHFIDFSKKVRACARACMDAS